MTYDPMGAVIGLAVLTSGGVQQPVEARLNAHTGILSRCPRQHRYYYPDQPVWCWRLALILARSTIDLSGQGGVLHSAQRSPLPRCERKSATTTSVWFVCSF